MTRSSEKLNDMLDNIIKKTPEMKAESLETMDLGEKLFFYFDLDQNGFLDKNEIKLFADATGFDEEEMTWDDTYIMLCEEYNSNEDYGIDLESFKLLCSAYQDHECYYEAMVELVSDLEKDRFFLEPSEFNNLNDFNLSRRSSIHLIEATDITTLKSRKSTGIQTKIVPEISILTQAVEKLHKEKNDSKEVLKLKKKLREIEKIQEDIDSGKQVDKLQKEKVEKKGSITCALQDQQDEDLLQERLNVKEKEINHEISTKRVEENVWQVQQSMNFHQYKNMVTEAWQRGGYGELQNRGLFHYPQGYVFCNNSQQWKTVHQINQEAMKKSKKA